MKYLFKEEGGGEEKEEKGGGRRRRKRRKKRGSKRERVFLKSFLKRLNLELPYIPCNFRLRSAPKGNENTST